jgi:hypothetical protein
MAVDLCGNENVVLFPAHTFTATIFSGAKGGLLFLVKNPGMAAQF